MQFADVFMLVSRIHGCTFASLDAITIERKNIRRITVGESVLLFGGSDKSGYEAMVKRRLLACGKNPDAFRCGPLPWGERIADTSIIAHKGNFYLQTILLKAPDLTYEYMDGREAPPPPPRNQPGLTPEQSVIVQTYNLENIGKLRLLGEVIE